MSRCAIALTIVVMCVTSCQRKPQQQAAAEGGHGPSKVLTVPGFKTPESVKYDADLDVYFVTNINGSPGAKDNNGFISRVRPDGTVDSLAFVAGGRSGVTLHAPKGTAIVSDTLWVADIDAVRGFNKRSGAAVATIELGKLGAKFLNDIAAGPDAALYITDTGIQIDAAGNFSHPGPDRIFRVGAQHAVSVAAQGIPSAGPTASRGMPRTAASSSSRSGGRRCFRGSRAIRRLPWSRGDRAVGTVWRC